MSRNSSWVAGTSATSIIAAAIAANATFTRVAYGNALPVAAAASGGRAEAACLRFAAVAAPAACVRAGEA
jgi:hypothetical protein